MNLREDWNVRSCPLRPAVDAHALSESTASSRSSDFRARRSQCPERRVLKPFSVENRRRTGVLHPRRRPRTNSSEPYRELARFTTARRAREAPAPGPRGGSHHHRRPSAEALASRHASPSPRGRRAARTIYHLRSPRTVEPQRATSCGSHGLDLHSPHAVRKGPARGCRAVRTAAHFFFVTAQRRAGTLLRECG